MNTWCFQEALSGRPEPRGFGSDPENSVSDKR